jgi:hypothetical protein
LNSRFRKARGLSICENSRHFASAIIVAALAFAAMAGPCAEKSEIVYNAMHLLAGSGDTIAVASYDQKGWALNLSTTRGDQWWGYSLECITDKSLFDMAFGNRTLAALFNPSDYESYRSKPGTIWWYSYRDGRTHSRDITWPDSVFIADTLASVNGVDLLAANGLFFIACRNGGLVKWNPVTNGLRGFMPGDTGSFDPATLKPRFFPSFGSANKSSTVIALDRIAGDTARIAVATPAKLWRFTIADSSWDSSISTVLADSSLDFKQFISVAVNNAVAPSILYAFIETGSGRDSVVSLFRYRTGMGRWFRVLKEGPSVIAPASRGYFYSVTGANKIELYRDSVSDSAANSGDLSPPIQNDGDLYKRLTVNKGIDRPDNINDMLFIPVSDSSGHFALAASAERSGPDGLYLSYTETPGSSTDEFRLLRRDKAIAANLKETYALPGIISDNAGITGASSATFVYKLGKDARVTIRIYDFNMQHVRTVVENAPRKAATATGRSTDSRADVWDGTTSSGRVVAPGVYYYKITTSSGERSFGKIVVAKGPAR